MQSVSVYQGFTQSYNDLEKFQLETDIKRVINTLEHHLKRLANVAKDTAGWDETYEYMESRDQDWLENNFTWEVLKIFDSDTLVIVDLDNNVVHAEHRTMQGGLLEVPKGILEQVSKNNALYIEKNERILRYGLVDIGDAVMLIGYYHITNTDENLDPRGRLLYGRVLNQEKLDDLNKITQLQISVRKFVKDSGANADKNVSHPININIISDDVIEGSLLLNDVFGKPVVEIVVTKRRQFFSHGKETLDYFSIMSVVFGVVLIVGTLLLMDNLVLKRITKLSREVKRLGSAPDFSQRIDAQGNDEIDELATNINVTLDELSVYFDAAQNSNFTELGEGSIRATLIIDSKTEKIMSARFYPDVIAGRNYGRVAGLHYNDLIRLDREVSLVEIVNLISQEPNQEFSAVLTPLGLDPLYAICRFSLLASVKPGLILCQSEIKNSKNVELANYPLKNAG